jgi:cytochrome bd-type quinol oxidase subunit 1
MVTAGFAGFLVLRMGYWLDEMGRPNRPQVVELHTKETPNQVIESASRATVKFILVSLLVIAAIVVASYFR